MKIKTRELTGAALDWAVTRALGITNVGQPSNIPFNIEWALMHDAGDMRYSTNWSQGGPIIERENISTLRYGQWFASIPADSTGESLGFYGPTPLIAAMRCYVTNELGEEVDVPEELA